MPRYLRSLQIADSPVSRSAQSRFYYQSDPGRRPDSVLGRKAVSQDFHLACQSGRYKVPSLPMEWNIYAE